VARLRAPASGVATSDWFSTSKTMPGNRNKNIFFHPSLLSQEQNFCISFLWFIVKVCGNGMGPESQNSQGRLAKMAEDSSEWPNGKLGKALS